MVRLAKEGIDSGAFRAVPAQLHFNLDLAMRDVDRVLEGIGKVGAGGTAAKRADQPAEGNIADEVGEHLAGNRRDKAAALRDAVSRELSDEEIASQPLSKIWPKESIDQIEEAFDNLFATIETKETDKGVAMFSRSHGNVAVEVTGNEAIRGIDRLQEAVRRHTGSRAARISESMSLADLQQGKGRGGSGATKAWQLAGELAGFFKQRVITFENLTPGIFDFNGVSFEGNIYLNTHTNRPAHVVFGHEFLHRLKAEHPAAYKKLMGVIRPMITDLEGFRKAEGIEDGFSNEYIEEELAANLTGNRFGEASFWRKVAQRAPGSFRQIVDLAVKMLAEIHQMFAGRKDLAGDRFITDVERARDAIADAVAEYNKATGSNFEPKFMTAYHGGPHDHDGFDSRYIGTGEGAQAYGWGHYFASRKALGEWYRNKLSGIEVEHNGGVTVRRGRLYTVELAPTEDELLDWDKPLNEQSERVAEILERAGLYRRFDGMTGREIYNALAKDSWGPGSKGLPVSFRVGPSTRQKACRSPQLMNQPFGASFRS